MKSKKNMAKQVTEKKKMGRTPLADPKEKSWVFIKKSIIEKNGGWDALKQKIYKFLGQE